MALPKPSSLGKKGPKKSGSFAQAPNNVQVTQRQSNFVPKTKSDSQVTSARLGLRRKIESDPSGELQERYLHKATKLIPNPVAREVVRFALNNVKKVEATSLNIEILSWATPFWLFLIFPAAVVSLVLAGAAYFIHDYLPAQARAAGRGAEFLYSIAEWASSAVAYVAKQILGFSLDPAVMFLTLNSVVFFMCLGVLIIMTIQYTFAGISCFLGKGSAFKIFAFIMAIFGSLIPFLNMFPWFMLWAAAVNINPE